MNNEIKGIIPESISPTKFEIFWGMREESGDENDEDDDDDVNETGRQTTDKTGR